MKLVTIILMVKYGHRSILMLLYSSSQRTQIQISSTSYSILKKTRFGEPSEQKGKKQNRI